MQSPNPANATPFSRRPALATTPLPRRLARPLLTQATGSTPLGLVGFPPALVVPTMNRTDIHTESDLKEWLDTHGFPAPQPSTVSCKPLPQPVLSSNEY